MRIGSHFSDDEVRQAEEKFAESLNLAQTAMFNLLANDVSLVINIQHNQRLLHPRTILQTVLILYLFYKQVEQVAQLTTFSEALLEYHEQCVSVLKVLTETLQEKLVSKKLSNNVSLP